MSTRTKERIAVYAPFARDAASIVALLVKQDLDAVAVSSLDELIPLLNDELGAVMMSEEALHQSDWSPLIAAVRAQPTWSAYPFILVIGRTRSPDQSDAIYRMLPPEVTNVIVLERPISSTALLSTVRWTLAGRRRQFITKDHLDELERNSRQQALMTRELAHRVRNTIAMLQSIVGQTMRPYPEMARVQELIVERFSALARTHDLLLNTNFQVADFKDLLVRTLSVHSSHFYLNGPPLQLSPQAALSFTLVVHELATNSIKYGALSNKDAEGSVSIIWSIKPVEGEDTLFFDWKEQGGPSVSEPKKLGFGSRLIRMTLAGFGSATPSYTAEGFALSFVGPLGNLTHAVVPTFE